MSFQVPPELDAHIREESQGVEGWGHGYLTGALVAFSLMAMAEAIRCRDGDGHPPEWWDGWSEGYGAGSNATAY